MKLAAYQYTNMPDRTAVQCTVRYNVHLILIFQLEERWEVYERHAQLVSREEERKMKEREREKDKKLQKRERLFKILQKREEGIIEYEPISIIDEKIH